MTYEPNPSPEPYEGFGDGQLPDVDEVISYLDDEFPKVMMALDDLMCACSRRDLSGAMGGARTVRDSVAVALDRYRELRDDLLSVL